MKAVYYRPWRVRPSVLVLLAAAAVGAVILVENVGRRRQAPHYEQMVAAARLAERCFAVLKQEHEARGLPIYPQYDPAQSGIVGVWMSPVTSSYGSLEAKQASINPNFAAVVVDMLHRAGVKEGDVVAMGYTGSFPALNACACAALQTMGVKPVVIASAAASQWGANVPTLLWVDMARVLHERGLIGFHAVAASLGGEDDRATDLSPRGRRMLREGVARSGLELIEAPSIELSVDRRMALYDRHAKGAPIACYVNVGGAAASVGPPGHSHAFGPGLTPAGTAARTPPDSVMARFYARGVSVINLQDVHTLCRRYGLQWGPRPDVSVGVGGVYGSASYNRGLAGGALAVVLALVTLVSLGARRNRQTRD